MAFINDRHPETAPFLFLNWAKKFTIPGSHLTDSCTTQFNKPRRVCGTHNSSMTWLTPVWFFLVLGTPKENNSNN